MSSRRKCAAIRSRDELNYFMAPLERENAELRREISRLKGQQAKPRLVLKQQFDDAGVWRWRVVAQRSATPA